MRSNTAKLRHRTSPLGRRDDPVIGCRILTEPFFWPRDLWILVPASFFRNTVAGKGYWTDTADALHLWRAVKKRLAETPAAPRPVGGDRYGQPVLMLQRLGQGAFRLAVTDGYDRRCAVSGEKTLSILDAAHIQSYGEGAVTRLPMACFCERTSIACSILGM
jgi:putative restriction endonuclease